MTTRELYTAVLEGNMTDEVREGIEALIEKLDSANAKRREKVAEKAAEKEVEKAPIRAAIYAKITNEPKTASTLIAEAGVEVKPQSIPSLLKGLIENGTVVKTEVKVTGKGKQRAYILGE